MKTARLHQANWQLAGRKLLLAEQIVWQERGEQVLLEQRLVMSLLTAGFPCFCQYHLKPHHLMNNPPGPS
jgi:hypothetical protein